MKEIKLNLFKDMNTIPKKERITCEQTNENNPADTVEISSSETAQTNKVEEKDAEKLISGFLTVSPKYGAMRLLTGKIDNKSANWRIELSGASPRIRGTITDVNHQQIKVDLQGTAFGVERNFNGTWGEETAKLRLTGAGGLRKFTGQVGEDAVNIKFSQPNGDMLDLIP